MKASTPLMLCACVFLAGVSAIALFGAAEPEPIVPERRIELFDGRSMAGWHFISKDESIDAVSIWSVADGAIHCAGKPNGYARTVAAYRDYALHIEWRWPSGPGNSGLFLHLTGPDKVWPQCLEVQLKSGDAGSVRANGGSSVRELDPSSKDPRNVPLKVPGAERDIGEWNSCDVVCRGNMLAVSVNGVLQNEITGASIAAGPIALQSEGAPIEFRNIVLTPLPSGK